MDTKEHESPPANQRANEAGGNDDEVELDLKESTWNGE